MLKSEYTSNSLESAPSSILNGPTPDGDSIPLCIGSWRRRERERERERERVGVNEHANISNTWYLTGQPAWGEL